MFKRIHSFFRNHYHTHYHGKYAHAKQLFIFDLALLGLAVVLLGASVYFFFWKPSERHLAAVQVLIGSDRIKSGDAITVTVNYSNTSKYILHDPTLSVRLPDGFVINRTSTPETAFGTNHSVSLKDLPPGAHGTLTVEGRLFSTPGKEDHITSILSFLPDHSTDREQEATPFNFTLPESILRGTLTVVSTTYPGKPIPVSYVLENTGNSEVADITLESNTAQPLFSDKDLGAFTLDAHATHTFSGTVIAPSNGNTLEVGVTPRVSVNGALLPQGQVTAAVTIFNPNIAIDTSFVNPPGFADVSGRLPITIHWKNNGTYSILNQSLEVGFTNGVVDLEATASLNGVKSDGTKLIITKKERTVLANGNPGSEGTIDLTLVLLPHFNLGEVENASLVVEPALVGGLSTVTGQTFRSTGKTISIPLATELSWVGAARYYTDDGEQLGRGPLPVRVGQTTRYFILFDVYNTSNIVSDASFVARLPENVAFTGKQSVTLGPKLVFDSDTRLVRWNYAQVPANSQTGFYFEVAVTPTASQVGQTLLLLEDARFSAKDDLVGKPFSLGKGAITNVLPASDEGSKSGSTVR